MSSSELRDVAPPRAQRADARRNRDKLVTAARVALTAGQEGFSLESVARDAGVGIGTLYRNFPTRDALVEAVYEDELEHLTTSAAELLERLPPDLALREWMDAYADFVATKRGIVETLKAGIAARRVSRPAARGQVADAIRLLLDAGARQGSLREDVRAEDVLVLLFAAMMPGAEGGEAERTGRLLDLVLDAVRATGR